MKDFLNNNSRLMMVFVLVIVSLMFLFHDYFEKNKIKRKETRLEYIENVKIAFEGFEDKKYLNKTMDLFKDKGEVIFSEIDDPFCKNMILRLEKRGLVRRTLRGKYELARPTKEGTAVPFE